MKIQLCIFIYLFFSERADLMLQRCIFPCLSFCLVHGADEASTEAKNTLSTMEPPASLGTSPSFPTHIKVKSKTFLFYDLNLVMLNKLRCHANF